MLKTFGRRGGRPLSARQQGLIDESLPKIRIPISDDALLDPRSLFPKAQHVWLEIGFGGGEHVSGQALGNPEIGLLASEVFYEGVAKLIGQIEDQNIENVRIWDDDARTLMARLETAYVDRAFILFPDPWPKTRHQKRRLIQPAFLDELARILRPHSPVRFATDVRSYADDALRQFLAHPAFAWVAEQADDWRLPPDDHLTTRYERKQLGDIAPVFYTFRRLAG